MGLNIFYMTQKPKRKFRFGFMVKYISSLFILSLGLGLDSIRDMSDTENTNIILYIIKYYFVFNRYIWIFGYFRYIFNITNVFLSFRFGFLDTVSDFK